MKLWDSACVCDTARAGETEGTWKRDRVFCLPLYLSPKNTKHIESPPSCKLSLPLSSKTTFSSLFIWNMVHNYLSVINHWLMFCFCFLTNITANVSIYLHILWYEMRCLCHQCENSNYKNFYFEKKKKLLLHLSVFHPTITALSQTAAILSSVTSVKSQLISPFLHVYIRDADTQTHTRPLSHPFSSPSDELLSCLLYIVSMQPQSRPAASHRTMRRTPTSSACSAFAVGLFSRQPSENLGSDWLWGPQWAGHQWSTKKLEGDRERRQTHSDITSTT